MSRTVRRFSIAFVLIVVVTVIGTVGGFFNVTDLINRVTVDRQDNEFGGKTTTKVAAEDKIVSWTKNLDSTWTNPIDDAKPYLLQEVLDANDKVVQYTYSYFTDNSFDATVDYYKKALKDNDIEVVVIDEFTSIKAIINNYKINVKVEEKNNKIEVYVKLEINE